MRTRYANHYTAADDGQLQGAATVGTEPASHLPPPSATRDLNEFGNVYDSAATPPPGYLVRHERTV